jgi:hypothetical protein
MAAGLGFKTFTTGEVLTAADTNGYLMQGINVFASAAARDAAITSPQEGQFAFTKDTNGLWYYDGAAWVASGATGDIEGVTAGIGISGGGTSGTVTVTNSMATAIDAKGDLIGGTGADTFARLAVGANDTVLTADSTAATGLKWGTAPSGFGTITAYTPTWTGITIGNGTFENVGYSTSGDLVWYSGQFTWGSTTSATGVFKLTLPVNGLGTATGVDGRQPAQNFGALCQSSTGYIYNFAVTLQNASPATTFNLQSLLTNSTYLQNQVQYLQNTVPITYGTNDRIAWNFFYRKA